jgi:hypothetical protein
VSAAAVVAAAQNSLEDDYDEERQEESECQGDDMKKGKGKQRDEFFEEPKKSIIPAPLRCETHTTRKFVDLSGEIEIQWADVAIGRKIELQDTGNLLNTPSLRNKTIYSIFFSGFLFFFFFFLSVITQFFQLSIQKSLPNPQRTPTFTNIDNPSHIEDQETHRSN